MTEWNSWESREVTDDSDVNAFVLQCLSVLFERYEAVTIQSTFAYTSVEAKSSHFNLSLLSFFCNSRDLHYPGYLKITV